jgi:hypothetical protein
MSYLNRMYGGSRPSSEPNKNTNRVLGGLRGHGADHYSILGEDGVERSVPTQKYVQNLEQKIKEQDIRLATLERRMRIESNQRKQAVQTFNRRSD